MSVPRTLHITNGDSAAGTMREARLEGQILPWRDVLHDGPVPGGLSLHELSRVRAEYLAAQGWGERQDTEREFAHRDGQLERFTEFQSVVLWFEWDLYDQLQLAQLLDFFAGKAGTDGKLPQLEIVSVAGYLGNLPAARFRELYEKRGEVDSAMLSLGRAAWQTVTSSDPRDVSKILAGDTSALPFLRGALTRFLEELPWQRDGLSRSERQLAEGIAAGASGFGDVFQAAAAREERIYCGDASAALYLKRLATGAAPLVSFTSNGTRMASSGANTRALFDAELSLTDTGGAVLKGDLDWIELGGSDRWLGGVHLDGASAAWRWDAARGAVREARTA